MSRHRRKRLARRRMRERRFHALVHSLNLQASVPPPSTYEVVAAVYLDGLAQDLGLPQELLLGTGR